MVSQHEKNMRIMFLHEVGKVQVTEQLVAATATLGYLLIKDNMKTKASTQNSQNNQTVK